MASCSTTALLHYSPVPPPYNHTQSEHADRQPPGRCQADRECKKMSTATLAWVASGVSGWVWFFSQR